MKADHQRVFLRSLLAWYFKNHRSSPAKAVMWSDKYVFSLYFAFCLVIECGAAASWWFHHATLAWLGLQTPFLFNVTSKLPLSTAKTYSQVLMRTLPVSTCKTVSVNGSLSEWESPEQHVRSWQANKLCPWTHPGLSNICCSNQYVHRAAVWS